MDNSNVTIAKLLESSHRLYDSLIKTIRKNVKLTIKRDTGKDIANHGIAKILANIKQIEEGVKNLDWKIDVESFQSTFKSQFSQFEKKVMGNKEYFKEGDLKRIESIIYYAELMLEEPYYLTKLIEERNLNISMLPSFKMDLEKIRGNLVEYRELLVNSFNSLTVEEENLMKIKNVKEISDNYWEAEATDINFWEASVLIKELIYELPSNLSYELDWKPIQEYFENLVLVRGVPKAFVYDTFDKNGDFPFMIQCGFLMVQKPSLTGDKLIIFEFENIRGIEQGKISKIKEIPIKGFYEFIETFLLENNVMYISPEEKKSLVEFINQIEG